LHFFVSHFICLLKIRLPSIDHTSPRRILLPRATTALSRQIATVRADLDYIQHFPTDRPYIALFPTGAAPNPAAIAAARAEVRRRLSARETAETWEDDAFEPRKGGGKASGAAAAASATAAGDSRRQKGQRHKGQQSEQSKQSEQGQQQPEAEESEEDDFFTTERPHRR
jgi:hypothetical protein